MVEPTSKQRFLDSCHFKRPGDLMVLGEEFHLFWPETLKTWVAQGAPAEIAPAEADSFRRRGIYESFGLVDVRYLREVLSGLLTSSESVREDIHGVSVGSTAFLTSPAHDLHVLEEDDHSLTFSDPDRWGGEEFSSNGRGTCPRCWNGRSKTGRAGTGSRSALTPIPGSAGPTTGRRTSKRSTA